MSKKVKNVAPVGEEEDLLRQTSLWKDSWRRLKKNKLAMLGLVIILIIIFGTIFAGVLTPYDYAKQDLANKFLYPSLKHPFGTDNYGRDILTRVLYGGRISLLVSVSAVAMALLVGGFIGALAAYIGGVFENTIMRLFDIIMAIPGFLLAVTVQAALGTGVQNAAIAIAIGTMPTMARIMRSAVLTVKGQEFVEAARAVGSGHLRIILVHLIPNTFATVVVNATLMLGSAILTISGLSFIGLGVAPPAPEWGSILSAGRQYIRDFWPIVTFPGLAIMATLFGFNLLGDGLRDALDPKLKQ